MVPIANVKKLGELKGVTVEVYKGLKHEFFNMNNVNDGKTSTTAVEHLMTVFVEPRLKELGLLAGP